MFAPIILAGVIHLFFDAAIIQEIFFASVDEFSEKDVGLMYERNCKIADYFIASDLDRFSVISRIIV